MKILDLKQELYYYEKLRFQYVINDEHKTYIADFYLPERNLIIEVKGEWFQKKDKEQIEAKRKSVLRGGYYYMMVGNKEIKELENMGA
jgi:very-short-patch-repair endonuclease